MMNIKAKIKYITPELMINLYHYLNSIINYSIKYRKIIKINKLLKNKYINQEVYIIANGPSLKNFNLKIHYSLLLP
jgi:hypothetical protein